MKRCPITYETITETQRYSASGLKLLSRQLTDLNPLPLSSAELLREAKTHATKMSLQGVQAKLSARLKVNEQVFEIVDLFE